MLCIVQAIGENMKVANAEYVTTIICRDTARKDTDKYTITVTNEHGSDSAEIDLVVLGQYYVCPRAGDGLYCFRRSLFLSASTVTREPLHAA